MLPTKTPLTNCFCWTLYNARVSFVNMIHKAFKYRLYPNSKQQEQLAKTFGCARFVFNHYLRQRIDTYANTGENFTYNQMAQDLTNLKCRPETVWLKEVNSQSLQQSLRNLDVAYNNFFQKRAKFPSFKKKSNTQSFQVPQHFNLSETRLTIPKMAPIRIVVHRELQGKPKSITISRNPAGQYFASILCEVPDPQPIYSGGEIGIDLGLTSFLVTSTGEKISPGKYYRNLEPKLAKLQRRLSRTQKKSRNRSKARIKVARVHQKVANQRADFLHRLSFRLVNENQIIHMEDLAVKNMVKNRKLAKSISDASWGEFTRQLEYKGNWYGCYINQVDRFFPSSKRCHCCGYIADKLPLNIREWTCPECGAKLDRDNNAAINILTFGRVGATRTTPQGVNACGETVRPLLVVVDQQWQSHLNQEAPSFMAG